MQSFPSSRLLCVVCVCVCGYLCSYWRSIIVALRMRHRMHRIGTQSCELCTNHVAEVAGLAWRENGLNRRMGPYSCNNIHSIAEFIDQFGRSIKFDCAPLRPLVFRSTAIDGLFFVGLCFSFRPFWAYVIRVKYANRCDLQRIWMRTRRTDSVRLFVMWWQQQQQWGGEPFTHSSAKQSVRTKWIGIFEQKRMLAQHLSVAELYYSSR